MQRYVLFSVVAVLMLLGGGALASEHLPGSFVDDDGNVHEQNIEAIAAEGVTRGCNPPANHYFCPTEEVTRGQMAAFLRRALDLQPSDRNWFIDETGHLFEEDIHALAEAGITQGCDPPDNFRYCPDDPVLRGEMAAFLNRAFQYPPSDQDPFTDDDDSVFESDIDDIAAAGVTAGCNPPDNDRFCPHQTVTRAQMASFLARALELDPIEPGVPDDPGDTVNCSHFDEWEEAQEWFELYEPHYGDVAGLDANGDGVACESLRDA